MQYFSNAGWLFPNYNKYYWLGLQNRTLPDGSRSDFQWLDPHVPGPDYSTYEQWGSNEWTVEPHNNGGLFPEYCAVAALDYLKDGVWGWMNVNCTSKHLAICRLQVPGPQPSLTLNSTNHTYYLNTSAVSSRLAEATCQANGGHLVSYGWLEEQVGCRCKYCQHCGASLPCNACGKQIGAWTSYIAMQSDFGSLASTHMTRTL